MLRPAKGCARAWPRFGDFFDECAAGAARIQRRPKTAGDFGLSPDQGPAGIRRCEAGTDLALRKTRLPYPRRHPDHAAGRGAEDRLMRARTIFGAVALLVVVFAVSASAEETKLRIGAIDAVLTTPAQATRPPAALLIAGSGPTDRDGNGPLNKPAMLKKLSDALVARGVATLRYDKRGAGGWKKEFGRPEDFRFKDYIDDATALAEHLLSSGKFSRVAVIGHSEGG